MCRGWHRGGECGTLLWYMGDSVQLIDTTGGLFIDARTGKIIKAGDQVPSGAVLLKLEDAEPYFPQRTGSDANPWGRTSDGYDRSHLSPEHAYRIGRDYLAHCIRYGWPMKVIRERFGPGARIFEMGCGKELPLFRTMTCDHSAVTRYKPARYVGADLNRVKYYPQVNGVESTILSETNIVTEPEKLPDEVFDLVISFEVLEHMPKEAGLRFLDAAVSIARRKSEREGKPGLCLFSTPVNGGTIAKNHIYEWALGEMERGWTSRGCRVVEKFGTFANLRDLIEVLTPGERSVWNSLASYHSPDVLTAVFSANHPEVARNCAWLVEVP